MKTIMQYESPEGTVGFSKKSQTNFAIRSQGFVSSINTNRFLKLQFVSSIYTMQSETRVKIGDE